MLYNRGNDLHRSARTRKPNRSVRRHSSAKLRRSAIQPLEERRVLSVDYLQFPLVSDQTNALLQDANLVNPWGLGVSGVGGNLWVASQATGAATSYSGDFNSQPLAKTSLVVGIPSGSPIAIAPNDSGDFPVSSGAASGTSSFLFGNTSGQISGWNANVPPPNPSIAAQLAATVAGAEFTGLAVGKSGGLNLLYAADFHNGQIDVFDTNFQPVVLTGSFVDPFMPAGFAPFNIQNFGGSLYVTYARQDAAKQNFVAGPGNGFIDVFNENGTFFQRLVTGFPGSSLSPIDAPWGLAIAPNNFGSLSNTLLVANAGDGRIEGFNTFNGAFAGTLSDPNGNPITIDGLHGISFGNNVSFGARGVLFYSAGPASQTHGLVGSIESADGVPIDSVGGAFSAVAGSLFSGVVATFADVNTANTASSYRATIAWGDGTSSQGDLIPLGGGRFNVSSSHVYPHTGTFAVTVTTVDPQNHSTTANAQAQVSGGAISLVGQNLSPTEGLAFAGTVASFSDADGNTSVAAYTATIRWGDGTTTTGTISASGSGFKISGSHTYAEEGSHSIVISLADSDGAAASSTATATVADGAIGMLASNLNVVEGTAFSGVVATFTDANPSGVVSDFTATIRWGDGTTTAGTITAISGGSQVAGGHTYADEGNFTVQVIVKDVGGASATVSPTANVAEGDLLAGSIVLATPTEGANVTSAVAVISDTNTNNALDDFTAAIDWGDGTVSLGTISGSGGAFTVSGAHVYADEGTFVVRVTMQDDAPGTAALTLSGNVTVAEGDAFTPIPGSFTPTEGHAFSGAVASFAESNPAAQPSDFTATIDWGDGTMTAGTIAAVAGKFVVSGSHTYAEDGAYPARVVIADDAPGTATSTANVNVNVADAPITTSGTSLALTEGIAFSGLVARLTDANPNATPADFTVTLSWGDGVISTGTVVANGPGGFDIIGSHAYNEGGSYLIGVNVKDVGGSTSGVITPATVADYPIVGAPVAISGTEGVAFSGAVATFTDADPDGGSPSEYTVAIDWGDGTTTTGVVSGSAGSYTVSGSHAFADEASGVTMTIRDAGGSSAVVHSPANIADADALTGSGATISPIEGQSFSGIVATFSNVNAANSPSDFTAAIDWGDGSTSAGTLSGSGGSYTVSGAHTYADEATHTARVVIADDAPGTATATALATVDVVDAPITPKSLTIHPTENSTFSGVAASFVDGNPAAAASDFTASIDWGDGTTTAGTVVAAGGGAFNVIGSHAFGEEGSSSTIHVSIQDVGGSSAMAQTTAVVIDAPLSLSAVAVNSFEASTGSVTVATFTDPGGQEPIANYSATIDWGDGVTSAGSIALNGGVYTVSGSHAYADEGHFTVTVSASEVGGGSGGGSAGATILEEILATGGRGTPTERWVNEVFHDLLGRQAEAGALTYWGGIAAAGGDRQQIIAQIQNSDEYRLDQTQALFQHYLHRAADPGAQTFGAAFLASGHTVEQLADVLIGSSEYFHVRGGGTNDGFIDALFADALGRPADPGARHFFDAALASGATTGQVALAILSSGEYFDRVVEDVYLRLVERPADAGGLNYWANQLAHGARDEQITSGIAASGEYFNKTAP